MILDAREREDPIVEDAGLDPVHGQVPEDAGEPVRDSSPGGRARSEEPGGEEDRPLADGYSSA
jgi:hypothetical protein